MNGKKPKGPSHKIQDKEYKRAMKRALARKPFLLSDGKYLTRDQVHDREQLRKVK